MKREGEPDAQGRLVAAAVFVFLICEIINPSEFRNLPQGMADMKMMISEPMQALHMGPRSSGTAENPGRTEDLGPGDDSLLSALPGPGQYPSAGLRPDPKTAADPLRHWVQPGGVQQDQSATGTQREDGLLAPFRDLMRMTQGAAPQSSEGSATGSEDLQIRMIQVPSSGSGFYSYRNPDKQWGAPHVVEALMSFAATWGAAHPQHPIGIGELSTKDGGGKGHKEHRQGLDVDIRPMTVAGGQTRTDYHQEGVYSRELTTALVQGLLDTAGASSILFNDSQVPGVSPCAGHDDHLHVRFR